MSRATAGTRAFAERLVAFETRDNASPASEIPTAFLPVEKLRRPLAAAIGMDGVRALTSRALALAAPAVPWLRALNVKADGSFEGLDELGAKIGSKDIAAGGIAVLAQLLGLLAVFIGEKLTLGLTREVWPDASLGGFESEGEET